MKAKLKQKSSSCLYYVKVFCFYTLATFILITLLLMFMGLLFQHSYGWIDLVLDVAVSLVAGIGRAGDECRNWHYVKKEAESKDED